MIYVNKSRASRKNPSNLQRLFVSGLLIVGLMSSNIAHSGKLERTMGKIQVDENVVPISFINIKNPAVFISPPTLVSTDPGVIRLDNVSDNFFNIHFAEWLYLDGTHAIEEVDYFVLSEGRYEMVDGSTWEIGSFKIKGNKTFNSVLFSRPFSKPPFLLLSIQTFNGGDPVTVRAKNITRNGFRVSLFEEDNLSNGHTIEKVSYLAISQYEFVAAAMRSNIPNYLLDSKDITDAGVTVDGYTIYNQEEKSADPETSHTTETIHIMTFNGAPFAQQVTSHGSDTTSLRKEKVVVEAAYDICKDPNAPVDIAADSCTN